LHKIQDARLAHLAVERYLQHFAREVFLAGKGFEPLQVALTVGISSGNAKTYLEIYEATRWQSRDRLAAEDLPFHGQQVHARSLPRRANPSIG